jgi:cytochrome c biogenesis protein CcmG, thiol:disulfide interchange protein DsbE
VRRFLAPLAVFAALVVFMLVALEKPPMQIPSPLIGKPMPAYRVPVLGTAGSFSPASMQGHVWVLNVWASWCPGCREEHPLLIEVGRKSGVTLVGLNYKDAAEPAQRWLGIHGDPFRTTALDADGRVGLELGVYGVPETFVIDKQGVIRLRHAGPLTEDAVRTRIEPLLKALNNG